MRTAAKRTTASTLLALALLLCSAHALALDAGDAMPEIGVKDLSGRRVDRASLAGKVVLVDFWATWCGPCKEELPLLQHMQQKYAKHGLVVIAISVDSDAGNARSFMKKMGLTLRAIVDVDHVLADRYRPAKMPSSYIVDRDGRVRHVHAGFKKGDGKRIEAEIRSLL